MLAHVVSLQTEIELLRIIVGTNLAKFDQHAGPVPVIKDFSIMAFRLFDLKIIIMVPESSSIEILSMKAIA